MPWKRISCSRALGHQSREPLHKPQRPHHRVRRPVVPQRVGLQQRLPRSGALHALAFAGTSPSRGAAPSAGTHRPGMGPPGRYAVRGDQPGANPKHVYDYLDCQRGEAENRIKEAQIRPFAARTCCQHFATNQLRVLPAALAHVLVERMRAIVCCAAPSWLPRRSIRCARGPGRAQCGRAAPAGRPQPYRPGVRRVWCSTPGRKTAACGSLAATGRAWWREWSGSPGITDAAGESEARSSHNGRRRGRRWRSSRDEGIAVTLLTDAPARA